MMDQETHNEMLSEMHNLNLNMIELINAIKEKNNKLDRINELLDERLH